MNRKILVTGGAGFIATNLIHYWRDKYIQDQLIIIDNLGFASNIDNIKGLIEDKKIIFIKGDICKAKLLEDIINEYSINYIINMAAESHVDRSIIKPDDFIYTNIVGTFNLLEAFRIYWERNGSPKEWRFLHISTDEVFGSLDLNQARFNEDTSYDPRSPYSASKASSDHLVMAWYHTYNLPVIISNCSNNFGPYQFPEKLIPLTIINCLRGQPISVYGEGKNIRDWLYVLDHIKALEKILIKGKTGSKYCIGGNNEINNIKLVSLICDMIDDQLPLRDKRKETLIKFTKDRPGHDFRYAIDSTYIKSQLGWEQKITLENGLEKTISWYMQNKEWWEPLMAKLK